MKEILLKVIDMLKGVVAILSKQQETEMDGQTLATSNEPFTLAVIVGHEKKAPGAVMHRSQGFMTEYNYNTSVALAMVQYGRTKNIDVKVIFRDGIGISGANKKAATYKPDACLELHFNSFNGVAHGTETLCSTDAQDVSFAKIIQAFICEAFDRTGSSRGVKIIPRSARGGGNVHGLPGIANCLVEPFFGDNQSEAALAVAKRDEYAASLVDGFIKWVNK
jgi:N-acetylmuramoyl-L-alanine amidase